MKLSEAMKNLLEAISRSENNDLIIIRKRFRTAAALEKRGLVQVADKPCSYAAGVSFLHVSLTEEGKELFEPAEEELAFFEPTKQSPEETKHVCDQCKSITTPKIQRTGPDLPFDCSNLCDKCTMAMKKLHVEDKARKDKEHAEKEQKLTNPQQKLINDLNASEDKAILEFDCHPTVIDSLQTKGLVKVEKRRRAPSDSRLFRWVVLIEDVPKRTASKITKVTTSVMDNVSDVPPLEITEERLSLRFPPINNTPKSSRKVIVKAGTKHMESTSLPEFIQRPDQLSPGDEKLKKTLSVVKEKIGGPSIAAQIIEAVTDKQHKILDFGAWKGRDATYLRSKGFDVSCYEKEVAEGVMNDVDSMVGEKRYDLIYANCVFACIETPEEMIKSISKVAQYLTGDGVFIFNYATRDFAVPPILPLETVMDLFDAYFEKVQIIPDCNNAWPKHSFFSAIGPMPSWMCPNNKSFDTIVRNVELSMELQTKIDNTLASQDKPQQFVIAVDYLPHQVINSLRDLCAERGLAILYRQVDQNADSEEYEIVLKPFNQTKENNDD